MVTVGMNLKDACSSLKESYDQPRQHMKKQRHYLSTKVRLVKAMVFPVVIYGCESWTIKKVEHGRIDADRKSTRLNSSHRLTSRMPSSACDARHLRRAAEDGLSAGAWCL